MAGLSLRAQPTRSVDKSISIQTPLHAPENAQKSLPADRCIKATLFEKSMICSFPPLGGHIVIRGFSGVASSLAQVRRGEASIMDLRRLAMIAAPTAVLAGCVVAWVAVFDSAAIQDTATAPIAPRLPLSATAAAAPSLAAMHEIAVSRVATPNARVADAFSGISLKVTSLTNVQAPLPSRVIEAKFDTRSSANAIVAEEFRDAAPDSVMPSDVTRPLPQGRMLQTADAASSETATASTQDGSSIASPHPDEDELRYLKYYVYSESPPSEKPAKIALAALSDVPLGTPVQEIERAAKAFGVDANFMKAVAKIESDFNPRERTGSYVGLFQLSKSEFNEYGSGEILNARDNAIAAANKFVTEAALFKAVTHMELTFANLYLVHQQGWEGAAEHLTHPQRIAWKSMCATHEGMAKGERWCKRAIWGNTLPAVKREWKSVDRLTSGAFVAMWRDRVNTLYARYPAPATLRPEA
jgi:Transglycosylase SLT domain